MDVFDQATAREERDREMALMQRMPEGPEATGLCLNCGEPLGGGARWCDGECLRDWQAREWRTGVCGA